jgi:hypothetical protein
MPSPHPTLRRPNLRSHPPLHPLLPHLPPLHNLIHHSLQQRPLRLLLHKRPLRPRRRHPRNRTKRPRTRISSRNRLALNGSQDSPLPPVFLSHPFSQCTREVLQEYYINLIRTDSSGRFGLEGAESEVEDSDMESVSSRSASPMDAQVRHRPSFSLLGTRESSSVLGDTATLPTIEQNMAFAALQHSLRKPP